MKKKTERKLIGHIGVDAGLVWVGDPCFVLHNEKLPTTLGKDWGGFCELLEGDGPTAKSFNYELGHEGLGVCVSPGFGDGVYPVYATYSDEGEWGKRIKSITIKFF